MTRFISRMTRQRTLLGAAALSATLLAAGAQAQAPSYTGPSQAPGNAQQGYAGPSSVPVMTVQEVLKNGRDDQKAILRGRIVSHDGGKHYTFDDGTGRIRADIDAKRFPTGVAIDDKTQVELQGEIDRDRNGVEFDVDTVRVM